MTKKEYEEKINEISNTASDLTMLIKDLVDEAKKLEKLIEYLPELAELEDELP